MGGGGVPEGVEYIEFVLKAMLPSDGNQSSGSVLTLVEGLIQHRSLGVIEHYIMCAGLEHQIIKNCQ